MEKTRSRILVVLILLGVVAGISQYRRLAEMIGRSRSAPLPVASPVDPGSNSPEERNGPMKASGMVIDADGNGIPGVEIRYSTSIFVGRNAKGFEIRREGATGTATTRDDGNFLTKEENGNSFTIEDVRKPSYAPPGGYFGRISNWSASFNPKPHFEFLLLPAAGTPEIHTWEKSATLPAGVTSLRFDLESGEVSEGGNASYHFTTTADGSKPGFRHTAEIAITGAATQPALMILAPKDGYQDHCEYTCEWGADHAEDRFYYRRGDRFGRILILISTPSPSGERRVLLRNDFNTSGGRNTEPVTPTDEETLKKNLRDYAHIRQHRLEEAVRTESLRGMNGQDLSSLVGAPDLRDGNKLTYILTPGLDVVEWTFVIENGRVSDFSRSSRDF